MSEFIAAVMDPDIAFLRYSLVAGVLASLAFGIIGTYVVARKISYIAGAIAHSVLGGIGAGLYLHHQAGWEWFNPMVGALAAAILSAIIIGLVSIYACQREDTVIGAIWAVGMATGLLFLAKTPGYVDPMSYLFGNILMLKATDLWLVVGLDVMVVTLGMFFYNKFLAVCFDDEFLLLRGVKADVYYIILLCMTALTVVLMVSIVGIVLVIALLTLPAAIAGFFTRRLWQMMLLAIILGMIFTSLGIGVSYSLDLPSGPTIIVIAGIAYLLGAVGNCTLRRGKR